MSVVPHETHSTKAELASLGGGGYSGVCMAKKGEAQP